MATLAVDDVALRPVRKTDGAAIVRLCRRREVNRFLSMPISSLARFKRYYRWARAREQSGICEPFVVTRHGRVVGLMQIRITHPGVGELGWILHPDVWGSHVFTTAAFLLCTFARTSMGLKRLEARIAVQNARATRAISKLGGVREAILRQSLRIAGQYFDEQLWAIVEPVRDPRVAPLEGLVTAARSGARLGAKPDASDLAPSSLVRSSLRDELHRLAHPPSMRFIDRARPSLRAAA